MGEIKRNLNTQIPTLPPRGAPEQQRPPEYAPPSRIPVLGVSPKKTPKRGLLIGCFVFIALLITVPITLTSIFQDDDGDGDKTAEVARDGAAEVVFSTRHVDASMDILVAHYRLYKNNACFSEYDVLDTVPGLGSTKQEVENENGGKTLKDVPNEYDLFVTVK